MSIPALEARSIGPTNGSSPEDRNASAVVAVDKTAALLVGLLSAEGKTDHAADKTRILESMIETGAGEDTAFKPRHYGRS
jgi:hypothetical protein